MIHRSFSLFGAVLRGLCLSAVVLLSLGAEAQESFLIAGGAGYKRPIDEIAQGFEAQGKVRIERFYGHMGQVLAQAQAGGKVALIFGEKDVLEKASQLSVTRYLPVGRGRLVLAWAKGRQARSLADLGGEAFARIGLADTKQAIFGKAGLEALQSSGLHAAVEKRLLIVSTVPQVSAYLVSGEIDAGFINLTEALAIRERIGGFLEVPESAYTPIYITAALLQGQDSVSVRAFVEYLQTPAVQDILKRYGL